MAHPLVEAAAVRLAEIAEEKLADDTLEITFGELSVLADELGLNLAVVVSLAKQAGLEVGARAVPKQVRGFNSNSHDRWHGPGSCKTHGGSGWEQITGFAGQKG